MSETTDNGLQTTDGLDRVPLALKSNIMAEEPFGSILSGTKDDVCRSYDKWRNQPVDWDLTSEPIKCQPEESPDKFQTTIRSPVSVTGPGTFFGNKSRTMTFEPTTMYGWWFDRIDLPDDPQIRVSVQNVWKTARNIVLHKGPPHNYMRMVEHIIALRLGMAVDNVIVRVNSGDPPVFDRGSMDMVEAIESAGIDSLPSHVSYVTVKETVTVAGLNGSFLTFIPYKPDSPQMQIDCAIDFKNAIGQQRVCFNMSRELFRYAALARTNTTACTKFCSQTIGKLFADIRNLGYTNRNILIAGRKRYLNTPLLMHEGKSLEPVWHRAMLDLLAAIALIDNGRFVGRVISYKAGHNLDVEMIRILYKHNMLQEVGLIDT